MLIKISNTLIITILMLVILTCGGSNNPVKPPAPPGSTVEQLIQEGWDNFESDNYIDAINLFDNASKRDPNLLEALNGLGWSYFKNHNLTSSVFNFNKIIEKDSTFVDGLVGFAIANFERDEYEITINTILELSLIDTTGFDLVDPDYVFSHDANVTSLAVRKILALSYYYRGEFDKAYDELISNLDPFTDLEPADPEFIVKLLRELEKI